MVAIGRLGLWVALTAAVGAPSGGSGDAPPDVRAAVARLKQELVEAYVRCDASAL